MVGFVVREPQSLHQVFHNTPELVPVEASVFRVEGDDHVIRAVVARAGVLRVDGLDESARELEVAGPGHANKIGGQEPGRARLLASTPNVAGELTKASFACRRTLVPNDHGPPDKRSTARRTWMMKSRSSSFSLLWLDGSDTPSRMASLRRPPMRLRSA
jgi:hypothetical protein